LKNNRENSVQPVGANENKENTMVLDLQVIVDLAEWCNRLRVTFLEFENEDFKLTLRKNQSDESITNDEASGSIKHAKRDHNKLGNQ